MASLLTLGPAGSALAAGCVEFDLVVSETAEELLEHLRAGRRFAAVVLDGAWVDPDREVTRLAHRGGAVTVVVGGSRAGWEAVGVDAWLEEGASSDQLETRLELPSGGHLVPRSGSHVVAVTGPGGTGASTAAAALAQGLAADGARTLLADLKRRAEQHVLHGLDPAAAGIGDLVDAHRSRTPDPSEIRSMASPVPGRGYSVLAGLRRPVGWAALGPETTAAALDGLANAYDVVVFDLDEDLEGEADGGSVDVEERNNLARLGVSIADVAVVIAREGVKGVHSMLRVCTELWTHGIGPGSTLVGVVGAADTERIERAVSSLGGPEATVIAVPFTDCEPALVHGLPLPAAVVKPLTTGVRRHLDSGARRGRRITASDQVVPGSLGFSSRSGH